MGREQGLPPGEVCSVERAPLRGCLGERAERSGARLVLGTTKEVLGFIIAFLDFSLDLLGFPILVLGFPRISIRILSGF